MNISVLEKAADHVRKHFDQGAPACAVILGSGWGNAVGFLDIRQSLDYADIPGLGRPAVEGHAGRLFTAEFEGIPLWVFQGRRHYYEGNGWEPVAIPVYLCAAWKVPALLLANAAGGIRDDLQAGDLMAIDDHINAMGSNPLIGNQDPVWGPRFADQSAVYCRALRDGLDRSARLCELNLRHGIYLAAPGPAYETPAEIRAFRAMGADAVGMSTVPEAMLARAAGIRVAGLSCITNKAAGLAHGLSHADVLETARRAQPAIQSLLKQFFREVSSHAPTSRDTPRR